MTIKSGAVVHDPKAILYVLGGDPGATTGLVLVKFTQRRRDGSPLWSGANLVGAAHVTQPEIGGATAAELDTLYRRAITFAVLGLDPFNRGECDIAALEEPLDGGGAWVGAQGQAGKPQRRDTAFRLGASYGALLAAVVHQSRPNRVISFPVKKFGERRGWMVGNRESNLLAGEALMRSIASPPQIAAVSYTKGKQAGHVRDHVLMALGVVNHMTEYYLEYFPRPTNG